MLDIRLVGHELTVALNETKVIDRQVIEGLCGLAFDPNEERPGPFALQGDHGLGGVQECRRYSTAPALKYGSNSGRDSVVGEPAMAVRC